MSSTLPPFYPLTPNNHAALVVIAAIISLIYAMLALGIKFFIRLNVTSIRDFDVLLFTGMVLYVVQTVCVIIACNHGLGQHRSAIMTSGFDIYSKVRGRNFDKSWFSTAWVLDTIGTYGRPLMLLDS